MVPWAYQKNLAGYAPAKESQLRKPDQNLNHFVRANPLSNNWTLLDTDTVRRKWTMIMQTELYLM